MKICSKCGESKNLSEFYKHRGKERACCKVCTDNDNKQRYLLNKEKYSATSKQWKLSNSEYYSNQQKTYRANNPRTEYAHQYYVENIEDIHNKHAAWYQENKEHKLDQNAEWAKANRDKIASHSAKRRALKLRQTPADADMQKIAEFYKESERLTNETGVAHHVDHIIPLSKGGLHRQDNLQILTATENLKKGAKLPSIS